MDDFCGRATAAQEIKKALRRGPTDRLSIGLVKSYPRQTDFQSYGSGDATVQQIRKLHSRPAQFGSKATALSFLRESNKAGHRLDKAQAMAVANALRKVSIPPQSSNARNTNDLTDVGGISGVTRQPAPSAKPSMFGAPSSSALSDGTPPPEDATLKALKDIFSKGPQRAL